MLTMRTLNRNPWSIFDELESLQEDMNEMFSGGRRRAGRRGGNSYPLVNVWSSEDGLVVDAELPGVNPDAVEISVVGDELTLSGKVNSNENDHTATWHRRERPAGEFSRTLRLPFRADAKGVTAKYTNGVLRVTAPRSEEEKPRKIKVEA